MDYPIIEHGLSDTYNKIIQIFYGVQVKII